MIQSPTIKELATALSAFQSKCKTVGYDANNPFFRSKYATLTALVQSTREDLTREGLAVCQLCEDEGSITTILMHTSGEFIGSKLTLKPVKDDPQGRGSCLTYSRRYAYAAILGLVSDDDDDANAASKPKEETHAMTTKDLIMEMGKKKFKSPDEFKAWRIDNSLVEDLSKATPQELGFVMTVLREYKNA